METKRYFSSDGRSSDEDEIQSNTSGNVAFVASNNPREEGPPVAFTTKQAAATDPIAPSFDVSFLLLYRGRLDDSDAALLRRQAKRYDIST